MDDEAEMTICDYCADEVTIEEADECVPDETGHCILCGIKIEDDNVSA